MDVNNKKEEKRAQTIRVSQTLTLIMNINTIRTDFFLIFIHTTTTTTTTTMYFEPGEDHLS